MKVKGHAVQKKQNNKSVGMFLSCSNWCLIIRPCQHAHEDLADRALINTADVFMHFNEFVIILNVQKKKAFGQGA